MLNFDVMIYIIKSNSDELELLILNYELGAE